MNITKSKKKSLSQKFKDFIKFIEDSSLFIKQCYHVAWSVEKIHKVKIQKLQGQKTKE